MDQQKSSCPHGTPTSAPGSAQDELARLHRQHTELLLALQPFANAFEQIKDGSTDPDRDIQAFLDRNTITPKVSMGDFRRAYDAVNSSVVAPEAGAQDNRMPIEAERKAAEHEYITTAFDYARDPLGSRDWTLYWAGWLARSTHKEPAANAGSQVIRLLREARATLETWKDIVPAVSLCADIDKALSANAGEVQPPLDMILHCSACGLQHIDAPDERTPGWKNEPHRSHLCHGCGHIWRPADEPTNGVAAIKTKGKADSPVPNRAPAADAEQLARLILDDPDGGRMVISSGLKSDKDGAMTFSVTNPSTRRKFNVYLALSESKPGTTTEASEQPMKCWCHECNKGRKVGAFPYAATTMILCPTCGNKRCPRANDHRNACTGSNEPGQPGSAYPARTPAVGAAGQEGGAA
jgi:hypothetical protein